MDLSPLFFQILFCHQNWCFWTVVLEKTAENPLDSKEIKQSILKEINPDCGSTAAEAEAAMLQPPGANSWLIEKEPDAGKDWRQKMKGATEDEMVRVDMNLRKLLVIMEDRWAWHTTVHKVTKSWTWLSNWATIIKNQWEKLYKQWVYVAEKVKLVTNCKIWYNYLSNSNLCVVC